MELTRLRREISDLDEELLKVLARRMRVSEKIGMYKKANDMTILQPKRWRTLINDHKKSAKQHEVSVEFISRLFKLIHQESIDIQENIIMNND